MNKERFVGRFSHRESAGPAYISRLHVPLHLRQHPDRISLAPGCGAMHRRFALQSNVRSFTVKRYPESILQISAMYCFILSISRSSMHIADKVQNDTIQLTQKNYSTPQPPGPTHVLHSSSVVTVVVVFRVRQSQTRHDRTTFQSIEQKRHKFQ